MKIRFSIKLFFTFFFFGTLLFFSLVYFEYKIIENKLRINSTNEFFLDTKNFNKRFENIKSESKNIIESIFRLDSIKNFNKDLLTNSVESIFYSHKKVLEIAILDKNMNYLLDVQRENNLQKRDIDFRVLSNMQGNKFLFSNIDLSIKNSDIQYPLIHTLKIAKKTDSYYVVLFISIDDLIDSLNSVSYIVEDNRYILYDKEKNYSWSKYYYPNLKIEELLPFIKDLDKNSFENMGYIYSRLDFESDNKLLFIGKIDVLNIHRFIDDNLDEILIIALVTFIISIILSLIFTMPLSTINRKLIIEKDVLYKKLKKSRDELNSGFEIIDQNLMYMKIDKDFVIDEVSNYFCKIYGYSKEELLGQHYSILYSKEVYEKVKNVIIKVLLEKKEWRGEVLTKKKRGEDYWVKSYVKAYYKNDEIDFITIIRRDISDNKKVEKLYEDLYYQVEQQNIIFQNVYSGIALVDLKGEIKRTNSSFCKIFLYKESEILSKNLISLVDKRSEKLLKRVLEEVNELISVTNVELIFLNKNGVEIYLELSLKMLPDRQNIVLVVNSLEDKRKLQELNLNLEQRVKEEVRKNRQKEKAHQEERLKNAKLTSIGTLAAGITHEINTPLTYLKGNFEMLQMDIDDVENESLKNEMNESCNKISDAINRISVIVESMREMSQSSSEAKEKTNIFATLVTSLTMAYNISKQIAKITLNGNEFKLTNIKKDDFEIFANIQKQRIEQVWVIIINNALDELKKVEGYENRELNIDILQENSEVIVRFSDNAGGIKDEILPKIFEPFISSKEHSGMGIGLNIAKKIVDEQEGIIEAYNSSKGAVFEVKLKAAD